jgi:hypothetical protein
MLQKNETMQKYTDPCVEWIDLVWETTKKRNPTGRWADRIEYVSGIKKRTIQYYIDRGVEYNPSLQFIFAMALGFGIKPSDFLLHLADVVRRAEEENNVEDFLDKIDHKWSVYGRTRPL